MGNGVTRIEILEKVKRGEIPAERGLELIKGLNKEPVHDDLIYYSSKWEKVPAPNASGNYPEGKDLIVFLHEDYLNSRMYNDLHELKNTNIIFVILSDRFSVYGNKIYINQNSFSDYQNLLSKLKRDNFRIENVIHFWSVTPFTMEIGSECRIEDYLSTGLYSVFYFTKALDNEKIRNPVNFLYFYLNKNNTYEPFYSSVSSFIRTLRVENPNKYKYKVIELDDTGLNTFTRIVKDEHSVNDIPWIKYSKGERFRFRYIEVVPDRINPFIFNKNGTYLITGGAGGLGLILAKHIAGKYKSNLVLIGRSELTRDKLDRIQAIAKPGVKISYIRVDISKYVEVANLVSTIKSEFGVLNGVIHAAGIYKKSVFVRSDKKLFDRVLSPKVKGTINLDLATRQEPLDFFILFSSVSAMVGEMGLSAYGSANGFLDFYSSYREYLRKNGKCSGKSIAINWPLWKEGGMQIDRVFEKALEDELGMVPLQTEKGLMAFYKILSSGLINIGVVEGDHSKIVGKLNFKLVSSSPVSFCEPVIQVQSAGGPELLVDVQDKLLQICSDLLKVGKNDIDVDTELLEYGVDSMMMIAVLNKIEQVFGDTVEPNILSEFPTISLLAQHLIDCGVAKAPSVTVVQPKQAVLELDKKHVVRDIKPVTGGRFMEQPQSQPQATVKTTHDEKENRVAIISMACRLPRSPGIESFWENLKKGRSCISETPSDRWDVNKYYSPDKNAPGKSYSKWAGYIDDIDAFDAAFFGIKDEDAITLDPQHRIILELTQELFDRAGYTKEDVNNSRTSIYLGANEGSYIYRNWDLIDDKYLKKVVVNRIQNMLAARISDFYNLRGASLVMDTACSSSLVALHEACRNILDGESDMSVVGGVELLIGEYNHIGFSKSGALSKEPRSYVFDERAGGFVLGEGAGLVLLKDYKKALADGDNIIGLVIGSAVNNDGHTMGLTVPDLNGQKEVISLALERSNISPDTISLYEAHGTGTLLGDPIEIKAATTIFRQFTNKLQYCAVGSVKSNIGHLLRAAGIAGVIKILLSMQNKMIPPTLNCEKPHPRFKFRESPFFPNLSCREWLPIDGVLRAAISSFGFGGTNAHCILEGFDQEARGASSGRKALPGTNFRRKRYWIGKEIEIVGGAKEEEELRTMLERLSRGEISVEDMV